MEITMIERMIEIAVPAEYSCGDGPERKIIGCNFVHRQNIHNGQIQKQVNPHDGKNASENGPRHIAARIAYFFAEIYDAIPSVDREHHRLQSKNDRDNERPSAGHRGNGRGCWRSRGPRMFAEQKTSSEQNQKRGGFQDRRKNLCAAAPANSAPLQNSEPEDDRHRDHLYVSREYRKKIAAVFRNHDADRRRRSARGKPIAPTNDESRVFSDRAAGKIVLSAAAWNRRSQFRQRRRAKQRIHSADNPNAHE